MKQELNNRYLYIKLLKKKNLIVPDCGLFEAKSDADIDCNGKDGGCIGN